jgi:predicted small secreted protein
MVSNPFYGVILLKKLLIIPLLLFLITACSTSAGVDNDLYNDGKEIIKMTVSNVKSGKMDFSKSQQMKVDNFQSKYKSKGYQSDSKNLQYYQLVFWVYISYMQYGADQQLEYMDKYNKSLNELKTKFNINLD